MTRDTVSLSRAEYTAKERAEAQAWENWRKERGRGFGKETQRRRPRHPLAKQLKGERSP